MEAKDRELFQGMITVLCEQYKLPATKARLRLYFGSLSDLTIEQVEKGITEMLRNRFMQAFPLPAEIREYALGNRRDIALAAYLKTGEAVSRVGASGNVVFDDPVIHRVIMSYDGGWPGVCTAYDDSKFKDDFLARYRALAGVAERNPISIADTPPYLPGITELTNRKNPAYYERFAAIEPGAYTPVSIGDKAAIVEWRAKVARAKELVAAQEQDALRKGREPVAAIGSGRSSGDGAAKKLGQTMGRVVPLPKRPGPVADKVRGGRQEEAPGEPGLTP